MAVVFSSAVPPAASPVKSGNHTRPVLPSPELLALPDALLRKAHVLALLGVNDSTLARWIGHGDFPPADLKTGRTPLWRVATVQHWMDGESLHELQQQHAALLKRLNGTSSPTEKRDAQRDMQRLQVQIARLKKQLAAIEKQ